MLKRTLPVTGLLLLALVSNHAQPVANADSKLKPEYQAWGDYAASFQSSVEFFAGGEIRAAAMSPDGKWVASAGPDDRLSLWDAAKAEEVARLKGHTGALLALEFSPDSLSLAGGGEDSVVYIWDAAGGGLKQSLAGHDKQVNCLAFSPDGKRLASGSDDGTVRNWEIGTARSETHGAMRRGGKEEKKPDPITAVGWSGADLTGGTSANSRYTWSGNGYSSSRSGSQDTYLAVGDLPDGIHEVEAKKSGSVSFSGKGNGNTSFSARITPEFVGLAVPRNCMIAWLCSKAKLHVVPLQMESPAADDEGNRWRANQLSVHKVLDTTLATIISVDCTADGSTLMLADSAGKVQVWTTDAAMPGLPTELRASVDEMLPARREGVSLVRCSPDGKQTAACFDDGAVKFWDAKGNTTATLSSSGKPLLELIWSADTRKVMTWDGESTINVCSAATGKVTTEITLDGKPTAITASPGLEYVLAGKADGSAQVWDITMRQVAEKLKGFDAPVGQVAWDANGLRMAACSGKLVRIYEGGKQPLEFKFESPLLLGFTKDTIVVIDGKKIEQRGWGEPAITGSSAIAWEGSNPLHALGDGKLALALGKSGAVFNLSDGKMLATISSGTEITSLDFHADGRVATGGADGQLRFWKLP